MGHSLTLERTARKSAPDTRRGARVCSRDAKVAEAIGTTAAVASQIHSTNRDARLLAARLAVAVGMKDMATVNRIMAPIDAALLRIEPEELTRQLKCESQCADMTEDVSEVRYDHEPTLANLKAWARDRGTARAVDRRLDLAILQHIAALEAAAELSR